MKLLLRERSDDRMTFLNCEAPANDPGCVKRLSEVLKMRPDSYTSSC